VRLEVRDWWYLEAAEQNEVQGQYGTKWTMSEDLVLQFRTKSEEWGALWYIVYITGISTGFLYYVL